MRLRVTSIHGHRRGNLWVWDAARWTRIPEHAHEFVRPDRVRHFCKGPNAEDI